MQNRGPLVTAAVLAISAIFSASASAKITENTTNPPAVNCPVQIEDFGQNLVNARLLGNFQLRFKNTADKQIIGITFHLDIMDAVGDFREAVTGIQYAGKVKPGKGVHLQGNSLDIPDGATDFVPGLRVYVEKVAFVDGSRWSDDGRMACRATEDYRDIQ